MPTTANLRQFRVHARHIDSQDARTLSEASFEAAAVTYVEGLHAVGDGAEISVIVRDVASGHEHCFRVDLGAGEIAPCG